MEIDSQNTYILSDLQPQEYCEMVLPEVSRTFALSIRILRGNFYKAILVSYLLCRILDTIEDSDFYAFSHQKESFHGFLDIFRNSNYSYYDVRQWVESFFSRAVLKSQDGFYYGLVQNSHLVISNYRTLPDSYQHAIQACVVEMGEGMLELAANRQYNGGDSFIQTESDLKRYCYFVAGTVGILTTDLLREYSQRVDDTLYNYLRERSVSMGLGLQMTNILKDCWSDYQRGICYIPKNMISAHNLSVDGFFSVEGRDSARKIIVDLVTQAAEHLDRGLELILSIPKSQYRVRLSCLWPLFFAVQTLIEIKANDNLSTGGKTKISRDTVKKLIRNTTLLGWSNTALRNYYQSFRNLL